MKNWLIFIVWVLPFTLMSNAWATPFSDIEYIMAGDFCAYDYNHITYNANVTGWLNVDLSSHTISNTGTPATAALSHSYNVSYFIDIDIDIGNDNDTVNDRFYTFSGTSELKLLTMSDIYLDFGDFGLFSEDYCPTNLPWLGEGEGAGLWHYADFDLHDLTDFWISSIGHLPGSDDLGLSGGQLKFTQAPVSPIPEPSTVLLLFMGFTGLAGYELSSRKK